MDGLIVLLIIIGIISKLTKKDQKKKKANASAPRQKEIPVPEKDDIPFTRDEWKKFLNGMDVQIGKPASSKPAPLPKKTDAFLPPRETVPLTAAKPALHSEHDAPEGSISTQGESAAEHAQHHSRILAEETRQRQELEIMQELRSANLKKLRTAVVMSEVLAKPLALRNKSLRR